MKNSTMMLILVAGIQALLSVFLVLVSTGIDHAVTADQLIGSATALLCAAVFTTCFAGYMEMK